MHTVRAVNTVFWTINDIHKVKHPFYLQFENRIKKIELN